MSVLSQLVSRIPGLDDYNDQVKQNAALTGQNINQGAQFMTLQGAMEDRAAKRATVERENAFRTRMASAKTDEERAQIAMEATGPSGVLTHLDRQAKNRATDEQAKARIMQQATQFRETKRLRQAEIDRMTNNDVKRDAQRVLDNEEKVFGMQLRAEAARLSGALGADTIMGFQPRAVPSVPTMQNPTLDAPAAVQGGNVTNAPQMRAAPSPLASAIASVSPANFPRESPDQRAAAGGRQVTILQGEIDAANAAGQTPDPQLLAELAKAKIGATGQYPRTPPVMSGASALDGNLDARDIIAAQRRAAGASVPPVAPVVPLPGNGVPRVRAEQPQMPNFTGSPREVRKAQNDWKEDMAKAAAKAEAKDGKIGVSITGGRESTFINRVVNSGNQAAADLENVVKLPISASRGILGGRTQGKSLFEAGKETLANTMTTQEVQTYNVFSTGFQRALAAIESMGLAPTNMLMHQMDAVIFKEGDTNFTKLAKLSQTRQIVEKGMETILANNRVDAETKALVTKINDSVKRAVPFTGSELIELQALQNVNPNATLKEVMAAAKQQSAPSWSDDKEKRYQELLRKQRGGT